jgi:tetratricopeptide (TPR) repeat protein
MTTIDIQTTISIVTGIINLVLLTFLINFFKTYREIAKEREDLIKEQKNLSDVRTQIAKDELALVDRQNKQLISEKDILQDQLTEILKSEGVDKSFILDNGLLKSLKTDFIKKVEDLTTKLEKIDKTVEKNGDKIVIDGSYHLSIGNGYIVNKEWEKATYHLGLASQVYPQDSNIHFTRGVCYANIRGGIDSDRKSIEAYSQAIIYLSDEKKETRNKAYIYRGAMYKRLGKLDEAENDINFGLSNTGSKHIKADGLYNLACIHSMKNDKENLLEVIKLIKQTDSSYLSAIKYHFMDYFRNFKDDDAFKKAIDKSL